MVDWFTNRGSNFVRKGVNHMQHCWFHFWLASFPDIAWSSHQVPPPCFKWRTPYQLKQKHHNDEWALCATFKQKLAKKEATNQVWDAQKKQLLTFKCAREAKKRDHKVAKRIWLEKIEQTKGLMSNGAWNDVERLVMLYIWPSKQTYF